jgi:APA family basic amino acid/polyamine antiporter
MHRARVDAGEQPSERSQLKRQLGLFELTATGVGIILGAGIYVLIGEAAGIAGNGVWLPFLISAVAAAFTGLSYAELASRYPKAGATFEYTRQAFGPRTGFVAGWTMMFAAVIQVSAVGIGFSGYFAEIYDVPRIPLTFGLIGLSAIVLWLGVRESVTLGISFALIELLGLLLAISVSARFVGDVDYLEFAGGFSEVMRGSALLFFAFLGFEQMANMAEETKEPTRNLPRSIIISVSVVTLIYMLVAITSVSAVDWRELAASDAPLGVVVERSTGAELSSVLSVIALFATANTVLFGMMAASRQVFGMARVGAMPVALARLAHGRTTPIAAIVLVAVASALFSLAGDVGQVAQMSNAAVLIAFVLVNASLLKIGAGGEASTRVASRWNVRGLGVVPSLGLATSIIMLAYTGTVPLMLAIALILSGILIRALVEWRSGSPDLEAGDRAG